MIPLETQQGKYPFTNILKPCNLMAYLEGAPHPPVQFLKKKIFGPKYALFKASDVKCKVHNYTMFFYEISRL